jgi:hypothetical protein
MARGGDPASGGRRVGARRRETHSDTTLAELRVANAQQLRRRQQVEAIFRRGGLRLVIELLEELVRHGAIAEMELDCRLAAYARLDPAALKITGGDRFAPLPVRAVGGR